MTVKEVVKLAAENLGREDLSDAADSLVGEPDGELKSLVRCFNLVENEIALDYFPLEKEETFTPIANSVSFQRFSSAPVHIEAVYGETGDPVKHTLSAAQISFPEYHKFVKVKYTYSPAQKKIGESSDFSGKISSRLLSFGVAGEFCLSCARYQEAAVWEQRFRDALRAANLCRRKLSVPSRRWV